MLHDTATFIRNSLTNIACLEMWWAESVSSSKLWNPVTRVNVTGSRLEIHKITVAEHFSGLFITTEKVSGSSWWSHGSVGSCVHPAIGDGSSGLWSSWSVWTGNFEHWVIKVDWHGSWSWAHPFKPNVNLKSVANWYFMKNHHFKKSWLIGWNWQLATCQLCQEHLALLSQSNYLSSL